MSSTLQYGPTIGAGETVASDWLLNVNAHFWCCATEESEFLEIGRALASLAPSRVVWKVNDVDLPRGMNMSSLYQWPTVKVIPFVSMSPGHGVHQNLQSAVSLSKFSRGLEVCYILIHI
jgi:hypothetical protein